jgi:hypothetical protein
MTFVTVLEVDPGVELAVQLEVAERHSHRCLGGEACGSWGSGGGGGVWP